VQPLYGRAAIVGQATAAMERALAGEGRPLVFTGEPGIGKSALAEHVAGEAAARQAAVAWGRCWEAS
jgi:MoxR-like ATPase